jgi:hypothetical protein
MPVVFTTPRKAPYVHDWLQAFGAQVVELPEEGAVRFKRMYVPETAWRLNAWIAPEIRDVHLHARSNLELPESPRYDVLWLSRAGLGPFRIPYDEGLLEWILGDQVTSIRPDTMTLAEQVAALEASRAVAGVVGSAFHTLLMTAETPECLYLCPPWDKGAFPAQHQFLDANATFAKALSVAAWTTRVRTKGIFFPGGYRMSIPDALNALSATVHPTLLDDARLAVFAKPEQRGHHSALVSELDKLVLEVLLDPLSMEVRRRLGAAFAAEGLDRFADEQLAMVADLTDPDEDGV